MENYWRTGLATVGMACSLASIDAGTLKFGGPIDGVQSGTGSEASGSAILMLDTESGEFDLSVNISGMVNPVTAAHIHLGPADGSGPPIVTFDVADFQVMGEFVSYQLDDTAFHLESMAALLSGGTYLNFHTEANPGGEVRGQLLPIEMSSDSLVNFSTRGMVNPGNGKAGLLIGGLALKERKTILFRMVADSLTRFGVQTSLKDTSFEVFQLPFGDLETAQRMGGNDDWKDSGHQFQILGTGYAPGFDNESAVIMTLDPGVYTMNADSEKGAGIALVETYGVETLSVEDFLSKAAGGELAQEFTILKAALEVAEIEGLLQGPGPFTLFAPTDEAFAAASLTEDDVEAMDPADVTLLLLAHIVGGKVVSGDLTDGETLTVNALDGGERDILLSGGVITVDNATVVERNVEASNGVIHVVNAVIVTE